MYLLSKEAVFNYVHFYITLFYVLLSTWLEIRGKDTTTWCFDIWSFFNTCLISCLFQEWNVTRLTFEYDSEPYGKERDAAIIKMANEYGVETVVRNTHTLYSPDRWVMNLTHSHCSWKTDTHTLTHTYSHSDAIQVFVKQLIDR